MKLLRIAAAIAVLLTGCTTTGTAMKVANSKWVGRSADEFFTKFGPPRGQFAKADGSILYSWDETHVGLSEGSTIGTQCALQIEAGPDRKIITITARADSLGLWQLSRCDEILN